MINYKLLYWFHGHKCPMSTIGFKAGNMAKKLLKLKRNDYKNAYAKIFFKSCAIDGVQISFPSTYGNNNLEVIDAGDMRFIFKNTKTDISIEIKFSDELLTKINNYLMIRKKAENNKTFRSIQKERYNELYKFVYRSKPDKLFSYRIF
jgi:formylmethanofuran dehydrogenase subunit E